MRKMTNLVGKRYGKLVVTLELEPRIRTNNRKRRYVTCVCDCGGTKLSSIDNLKSGAISCCGCTSPRHGGTGTKLHNVWHGIVQRCTDKNYQAYHNYGGRGITLCTEWREFKAFRDWALVAGYTDGLSIERINNDGNYEPNNCKWIPKSAQARNRRTTVWVEYNGQNVTASEYAHLTGIPLSTVCYRVRTGALHAV